MREYNGLSAAAIVAVLVPRLRDLCEGIASPSGLGDWPWDPDDFSRCRRVLALIPGGAERLGEVAAAYQSNEWKGLAAAWPELEALWLEEENRADRRMPKLYARMLRAQGRAR
jgi:hypothetical protein